MRWGHTGRETVFGGILGAALALALVTPAAAFDIGAMTDAERDAFRAEVRDFLLDEPQILLEVIDRLESRQAEAQTASDETLIATNAQELFHDDHSWVGGNPEGDVTLVEFVDYSCGFCKRAHPEVMDLLERDGNIRFVVKEFPILGPESEQASRFAIAVLQSAGDEAYAAVMDRLLELAGPPVAASRAQIARDLGLDLPAIEARMDSAAVSRVIDSNRALAARLQINGTPTFVTEVQLVRGFLPLEGMQRVIEAARGDS
ncbi:DsbA family protein [Alkalilacustris brevis]|uniref:DsbA family protein n=1 Tax=Alkalilacustris brevis TaxID=2026338 RepID=UPI000E0DBFAF|nr:DsbA family protein [Alkalilacustris brevis]